MKNIIWCALLSLILLAPARLAAQDEGKFTASPFFSPLFEKRFYFHHTNSIESVASGYGELSVGGVVGFTLMTKNDVAFSIGYFKEWNMAGPYHFSFTDSTNQYQGIHISFRFPFLIRLAPGLRVGFMYNGGKYGHAPLRHWYTPGDRLCDEIGFPISWQVNKEISIGAKKYVLVTEPMLLPGYVATDGFVLQFSLHFWTRWLAQ